MKDALKLTKEGEFVRVSVKHYDDIMVDKKDADCLAEIITRVMYGISMEDIKTHYPKKLEMPSTLMNERIGTLLKMRNKNSLTFYDLIHLVYDKDKKKWEIIMDQVPDEFNTWPNRHHYGTFLYHSEPIAKDEMKAILKEYDEDWEEPKLDTRIEVYNMSSTTSRIEIYKPGQAATIFNLTKEELNRLQDQIYNATQRNREGH